MMQKLILQEMQLLPEIAQKEILDHFLFIKNKYINKMDIQNENSKRPTFGYSRVKITMTEDFDEILEDY